MKTGNAAELETFFASEFKRIGFPDQYCLPVVVDLANGLVHWHDSETMEATIDDLKTIFSKCDDGCCFDGIDPFWNAYHEVRVKGNFADD